MRVGLRPVADAAQTVRVVEHEGSDAEADDSNNVDEESDASDDSGEQAIDASKLSRTV